MLLCISGWISVCFECPSKHSKLHQGVDYIIYLLYYIDFETYIIFFFNVFILSLDVEEIFL